MHASDLQTLIARGEDPRHQFKRDFAPFGGVGGVTDGVTPDPLLALLVARPGMNATALAQQLALSKRTIERQLRQLKQAGAIEFRGAPKTGGYYPCRNL